MAKHDGNTSNKNLLDYVGHIHQAAGMRRLALEEGVGKGASLVQVWTGTGFDFDVLLDRGMDISQARFKGMSLAWRSPMGDAHPSRYDDKGIGWVRIFPGGLVTTCGLTQMGAPSRDGTEDLGLHGRYTSIPATQVCQSAGWEGKDYVLRISGEMREAVLFGENLVLRREIETRLGWPGLILRDTVKNEGCRPSPHMILYHCNFGYPFLDENAILETPHTRIEPRDAEASEGLAQACRFEPPRSGYKEKVYFHHLKADRKGVITARLTNTKRGLAVIIRYRYDQLPYFTQWKMMGKGEYVCGLEPGNALVLGRASERKAGRLTTLKPGETRQYEILFQVETHNGETA